jgi:hypothetical protein
VKPGLLVAAQAAVVGIATVVVFVTLLSPEADNDLFGIQSPGLPDVTQQHEPSSPERARGDRAQRDDGQRAGAGGAAPAPGSPAPSEPIPEVPGPAPAPPAGIDDGPAADQYTDSVGRLIAKLY